MISTQQKHNSSNSTLHNSLMTEIWINNRCFFHIGSSCLSGVTKTDGHRDSFEKLPLKWTSVSEKETKRDKRQMNFWTCSFCLCLSPSGLKCIKCCFHFFVTHKTHLCNTVANLDFTRRCNGFTCMAFNREASLGSCTKRNRLIKFNHRLFVLFCLIVPSESMIPSCACQ